MSVTTDPRMREPLFRVSAPTSWPRGLECVLDYDGYVLNDLRRADRIVVESIGGLTGPDLAAEAEKNPDRDGETPYDLTYGGRTVTLRGYVEAGTLETMRSLYSYVLDAFDGGVDPSAERPLWFRWLDWRDFFVDSNALSDYVFDSGSGTVSINAFGVGLVQSDASAKSMILRPYSYDDSTIARYTYGDGEAIVRFKPIAAGGNYVIGIEARRTSATQKLRLVYDKSAAQLKVVKVVAGTPTTLASAACPPPAEGSSSWISARLEGASISLSMWSTYPPDIGGAPTATVSYTLVSPDSFTFASLTSGQEWGLYWVPSGGDVVEMLDVGAVNKGDAVIMCRKAAQAESDEVQDGDRFKRSFAVALRASDARMTSRKPTTLIGHPRGFNLTFPADGSGLTFPADGSGLVFGAYLADQIVNLGRSPSSPLVRLHGPMTNPVLLNPATSDSIGAKGYVGTLDYYEFDCGRHTVVDSTGASVYRNITDDTTWLSLASGANSVVLGADDLVDPLIAGSTAVVVASTDVFTLASHGLVDGQAIVVEPIGTVGPFVGRDLFYVRDSTTNTFKVTASVGGAPIDVTSNGSVVFHVTIGYVEFVYRHSSR